MIWKLLSVFSDSIPRVLPEKRLTVARREPVSMAAAIAPVSQVSSMSIVLTEQKLSHPSYDLLNRHSKGEFDREHDIAAEIVKHLEKCDECRTRFDYIEWFNGLTHEDSAA